MMHKYDLALSFAGEQRDLAEEFARRLDASGYAIFYDEFQQAELWGGDLSVALADVYSKEARYCLDVAPKFHPAASGVGRLAWPCCVTRARVFGAELARLRSAGDHRGSRVAA